ncbi:heme o synthase [Chitinophaga sedimenti]|uniref:heme o synthase n=1 Tax=Chitinophaga sedimenti TaxID=2033606 RepID=UPI0020044E33|nr:heme o synthase [Chitinophaga sedimenti]MCK7558286.1 heme o synthase [Chitinophaga sedimenti]
MLKVLLLFTGGVLVSGAANTINQILERETDKLMARTAPRPLPSQRITVTEAVIVAIVAGGLGLFILAYNFNWLSAGISLASLILYGFVYTPWKKWNSLAVLVGAIPGALPPLIGWTAGSNELSEGGWALFAIQFLWQFPHFWAIAWIAHTDYMRAGFKLLPSAEGPNKWTALQSAMYALLLIPAGLAPFVLGLTGWISAIIVVAAGLFYLYKAIVLYKNTDVPSARKLMFSSYIYLTIVMLALAADKVKM